MITCTVRMLFGPGLRDEAVQVLRALVGPVRSQPGCTHTQLMSDVQNDAVITWVSRWRRRSDLDRHLGSNHFRRILSVVDFASEPPTFEFEVGNDVRGFELIEEVLGDTTRRSTPAPPTSNEQHETKGTER